MKISVIGLGKLGKPILEVFSEKFDTIGIDIGDSFKDLGDISFVVVPTPSDENGRFTSKYVENVLDQIKIKHKVVIVSTLFPGETDRLQKKYPHLDLVYNPTFVALGSVRHDFTHPETMLIGSHDPMDYELIAGIMIKVVYGGFYIAGMKPLEAEIAKLALNCYITTKITFANQIGNLCYKVGADASKVLKAIGNDSRIGEKYLKAGLGYGGPCFPRDNIAMSKFFLDNSKDPALFKAVHDLNGWQVWELLGRLRKWKGATIGFSGLSYKKGTDVTEESQLKAIHDILQILGYNVKVGRGDVNVTWEGIE